MLMMRLFNLSRERTQMLLQQRILYILSLGVLGVVGFWAILSIVALSVRCSTSGYIAGDSGSCSSQVRGWSAIA
jgi:hypothetical protein